MNAVKSGALLLALAAPFALYAAWQVHSATRLDALGVAPPPSPEPPRNQTAAAAARATTAAAEARKAIGVTWRYRAPDSADRSADPDADATMKAAGARAADLTDLDTFLSGIEKPAFVGKLKDKYATWAVDQAAARRGEGAVQAWLVKPPPVESAADADRAVAEATKLIDDYTNGSRFANKSQATVWRLEARLKVVDRLAVLADRESASAIKAKLPLDRDTNVGTAARDALHAFNKHLIELGNELRRADGDKVAVPPEFRKGIEGRGAGADEYTAREELLALFAQEGLFDNPTGAEQWLNKVHEQYARTKSATTHKLIRDKVQEFADTFIPPVARLDNKVLVNGAETPRKEVVIKYEVGNGEYKQAPLSDEVSGLTELNFTKRHPGDNTRVRTQGAEEVPGALKPTPVSQAAVGYNAARERVSQRAAPRWTAESVAALKKACEPQMELVDQLRTPEQKGADKVPRIATRVLGLSAGVAAHQELFESAP
ncbi:hypothetical protein R5W23_000512 [Gemmata sp. JC673]|uniref:Uncharacterized protein n=1 Tax=Gemmata algarum TaxID=2975278 RepID=A0ABU5EX43_9BACT|nr:hypothetical protein [Gemmata algarum]MDY3559519.1 hypothetical protein [Gemmata algarum]